MNSIESGNFPMIRETPLNESGILEETYKSALEYCENNYKDSTLKKTEEFKKGIDSVEIGYEEITQK